MKTIARYTLLGVVSLALGGCGLELGYPLGDNAPPDAKLRIFVTSSVFNGNLGATPVTSADNNCMGDANRPATGTFRALFSDQISRSGVRGNQINWVLKANRTYVRPDQTLIGTTDSGALFPFPLENAITTSALNVWTGMNGDFSNGVDCSGWRDNTTATSATFGSSAATASSAIANGTTTCDQQYRLYCVEQ